MGKALDAIRFYSSCEVVKYVHIIWSEKEAPQSNILLKYRESDTPSVSPSYYRIFQFIVDDIYFDVVDNI